MIKTLTQRIARTIATTDAVEPDDQARSNAIRMATAVLMAEVARADYDFDESEFHLFLDLITRHFQMPPEDAAELANQASAAVEDYVSLHSFTQLLNKELSTGEKEHIISLLWQIAYADSRLDKYEDSLVMKISDLLYVRRGRVMRLKHDANPQRDDI